MALKLQEEDFDFAWEHTKSFILYLHEQGLIKRNAGHMAVVMSEKIPAHRGWQLRKAVVWEAPLNPESWGTSIFHVNARTKAVMSARDGKTTRDIIATGGSRQIGDFNHPGGIYKRGHGYGFSGVEPEGDELISRVFIGFAEFSARRRREKTVPQRRRVKQDGYIGGSPHKSLTYEVVLAA